VLWQISQLIVVPYEPYKLRRRQFGLKQKGSTFFTVHGQLGVPLKPSDTRSYDDIDDSQKIIFEGCGAKITYVIQVSV
jgi:hypothetical protein